MKDEQKVSMTDETMLSMTVGELKKRDKQIAEMCLNQSFYASESFPDISPYIVQEPDRLKVLNHRTELMKDETHLSDLVDDSIVKPTSEQTPLWNEDDGYLWLADAVWHYRENHPEVVQEPEGKTKYELGFNGFMNPKTAPEDELVKNMKAKKNRKEAEEAISSHPNVKSANAYLVKKHYIPGIPIKTSIKELSFMLEEYAASREKMSFPDELCAAYESYVELLTEELNELVGMASLHGWKTSRFEKGAELRENISRLRARMGGKDGK